MKIIQRLIKYLLKFLSFERLIIAGLSEKNVISAANEATPGNLNIGFINGARNISNKRTTPNSIINFPKAPERTVIPKIKNTVTF